LLYHSLFVLFNVKELFARCFTLFSCCSMCRSCSLAVFTPFSCCSLFRSCSLAVFTPFSCCSLCICCSLAVRCPCTRDRNSACQQIDFLLNILSCYFPPRWKGGGGVGESAFFCCILMHSPWLNLLCYCSIVLVFRLLLYLSLTVQSSEKRSSYKNSTVRKNKVEESANTLHLNRTLLRRFLLNSNFFLLFLKSLGEREFKKRER
jgi:hypothetical protein